MAFIVFTAHGVRSHHSTTLSGPSHVSFSFQLVDAGVQAAMVAALQRGGLVKRAKRLMGDMQADAELAGRHMRGGASGRDGDGQTKERGESKHRVDVRKGVKVGLRVRGKQESEVGGVERLADKRTIAELRVGDEEGGGAAGGKGGSGGSSSDRTEASSSPGVDATVLLLLRVRESC